MKRTLFALALSSIAVSGCNDDGSFVQLEAGISVSPQAIDFGPVQVTTTIEREVLITNAGEATLRLNVPSTGEAFDDAFSFEQRELAVVPGGSTVLTVRFAPLELGVARSTLFINPDDAKLDPVEIVLVGEGVRPAISVEPRSLAFGNVLLETDRALPIEVSNDGQISVNVALIAGENVSRCSQSERGVFCIRDGALGVDSTLALGPGESATLDVEFAPVTATAETGSFALAACETGEGCRIEVALSGAGVEQGFVCAPAEVDFGNVNPGSCVTQTIRCENIANERVTVLDWGPSSIGGGTSTDFSFSPVQVAQLNPGSSIDIDATYCPGELGEDEGGLEIETDNPDARRRSIYVDLSGSGGGPDISVLPDLINFGLVSLIAPSQRAVLIQNDGQSPLTVTEIVPDLEGTGAFSIPGGASAQVIGPGESVRVLVEFQPVAEGLVTSALVVKSDDRDEPEVTVVLLGEGVSLPPCSYELAPASLNFAAVEVNRFLSRAFEIRNVGDEDCLVSGARFLPGSDPEFSLPDGDVTSLLIASGSSATIRVEYSPLAAGAHTGMLELSISDPLEPVRQVPLSGLGVDGALLIVPNDLDFGTIGVGCSARARTVTIYNTGLTNAQVTSILLTEPGAFVVSNVPSLPRTLGAGQLVTFDVVFSADNQASYAGAVEVGAVYNGGPVSYLVALSGVGDFNAARTDEFEQLDRPEVDVLFVIDDSGTMTQEQAALAANFDAFIQFATAQGLDYQIGVTTTDVGDGNPAEVGRLVPLGGNAADRIVTQSSQPSPEVLFAQNANVGIDNSTVQESGLEAAYLALSSPLITGHNAGLLRQNAVLSVVFVSDEPDQSPQPTSFYSSFFQSIKGFRRTELFSASAIVGDAPGGCSGPGGSATNGARYIDVANFTGGIFQSICTSDWARALEDLSTSAFGFRTTFDLTNQPVPSTIQVYIDDVPVPDQSASGTVNWSYDASSNSINFSPFSTPQPGSQLRVEYVVECL